jgi:hypothetical protein
MYKDWHDLTKKEQENIDSKCSHDKLFSKTGPMGRTGDYICAECKTLKSGQQWKKEGHKI